MTTKTPHIVTLLELARGKISMVDVDTHGTITSEAEGAIRNGTRVVKVTFEPGDYHPIGAMGTVRGSVGPIDGEYGYFLQWDDLLAARVFVRGSKLKPAT